MPGILFLPFLANYFFLPFWQKLFFAHGEKIGIWDAAFTALCGYGDAGFLILLEIGG